MSEDIYSKPDQIRKGEVDKMEDGTVVTYCITDTSKALEPITEAEEAAIKIKAGHQRAESVPPERRSFRAAAVCLGLLCVLLLAGVIGLGLRNVTVTIELQGKTDLINGLTKERDDLQRKLNNTYCAQGWERFGCSFYYVSEERKTWEKSRQDCRDRGADLVIINSRQELDFIHKFEKPFWIGLSNSEEEGIWKWVDGTLPEEHQFWRSGEPNGYKGENCGGQEHTTAETSWNDLPCYHTLLWVCERNTTL